MIDLAKEIYQNLLAVTDSVHFAILPDGVDASVTHIVYDLYESGSYNLMNSNNYANDVELTIKILNPDSLELLRIAEQIKKQLLSNPYEFNRDLKYKNSVPIFPDDELETLQLTLLFSVYYDSTVQPFTAPIVVERGVSTILSSGAVYEVKHLPVSITDRKGVVTIKEDGESYVEAPVAPVKVTDRKGVVSSLDEGATYVEAPVVPVSITDRKGATIMKGEGEFYVESPIVKPSVINKGVTTLLNEGDVFTVPAFVKPSVKYGTTTTALNEGQVFTVTHKNSIVTNNNLASGQTITLGYGVNYTVPLFVKPSVTDRKGVVTALAEGATYVEAPVTSVSITDRFGATILKGEGEFYIETAISKPKVTDRKGVVTELAEGATYVEAPVVKPFVINLNDNTQTALAEGEQLTIPLIQEQIDLVLNYPVDSDNSITITVTEAATYSVQQLVNVSSVVYTLNTVAATLPITLNVGDTLKAEVVRTDAASAAKATLKNY